MWNLSFLQRAPGVAPLILRLVVGVAFFAFHGLDKVRPGGDWDFGEAFAAKHDQAAPLLYLAAWVEFLAGFALAIGFLTRWAAIGLLGIMLVAIFVIHAGEPYEARELAIAYAGACIAIAVVGPGSLSLDRLFFGSGAVHGE